jgi:hypothetical protein
MIARRWPSRSSVVRCGAAALAACLVAACAGSGDESVHAVSRAPLPASSRDTAPVRFTIDAARRTPISPFIYGVNGYGYAPGDSRPLWPRGLRLSRFGGNRLTAYNWENNASNAGSDYEYENDDYLGGGLEPGEAVRLRVRGALASGAGIIVTVPMIGYVARDLDHTSVGTDPATLRTRLASRFVPSYPSKSAPLSEAPDGGDNAVYQDEFVWWLTRQFPRRTSPDTTPILFTLDNEPDLWSSTHEEIMPKVPVTGTHAVHDALRGSSRSTSQRLRGLAHALRQLVGGRRPAFEVARLSYDDFIDRTIAYARGIKHVAPDALVLGPGTGAWAGAATLGRWPAPDPRYGGRMFLDVYLDRLREAERISGQRLVDVLDVHWYPEALVGGERIDEDMAYQSPAMVEARLQAPRSLWDPTYDEKSWVSGVQGGPVRLLPLLREKIAAHYPGTKIAISEYFYGRGGDVSGGIAQADVLGIFGREGVFAATLWPSGNAAAIPYGGRPERAYRYVVGAFRMFRDYDGHGGAFGSLAVAAANSDPATTSVYASADDDALSRMVLVIINKRPHPREAAIDIADGRGWRVAETYTLTDAAPAPRRAADIPMRGARVLRYVMPAMSVSTIVLRP